MTDLDQPEEFDRLKATEKRALLQWIGECFEKSPTAASAHSYGMKHWFQHERRIYVTNGAYKGAMLAAGFAPVDCSELNWQFYCRWTPRCTAKTRAGAQCKRRRMPTQAECSLHFYMDR